MAAMIGAQIDIFSVVYLLLVVRVPFPEQFTR